MAITKSIIKKLKEIVGKENFSCFKEDLVCYSFDSNNSSPPPDIVLFPSSKEEIASIVKLANENKISVTVRGNGSGTTGGALPIMGGIVISMSNFNKIIEIDKKNFIGIVQTGVITGDFKRAAEKEGLFYPPDPSSSDFSTIGGNVAECAGGLNAVKYGVTKDYVLGLTAVLPTGEIIKTGGKTKKNVVGYDLTKLITGSEGTLAIITEITLKLIPKRECSKTSIIFCNSIESAIDSAIKIIHLNPKAIEFMDKASIECVKNYTGDDFFINEQAEAVLIIEIDGIKESVIEKYKKLKTICDNQNIKLKIAETETEKQNIWKNRKSLSPALFKYNKDKINEDIVLPISKIPEIVRKIEKLKDETNLTMISFGHAGDGNIHFNIMLDKDNPDDKKKALYVINEVFNYTISLGGSISGEHGIGTTKKEHIKKEIDDVTLSIMKKIKKTFDPNGILNPYKIFP